MWFVLSPGSLPTLGSNLLMQPSNAPYCSQECLSHDRPTPPHPPYNTSSLYTLSDSDHDMEVLHPKGHWSGSDREGIRLWAANIPLGAPDGTLSSDASRTSSRASSPPPMRKPKLLLSNRRPAVASLCISTPHPAFPQPSRPIVTQQSTVSPKSAQSAEDVVSSTSSLHSGITDPFVATPSSASAAGPIYSEQMHKSHVIDALAIHVRSWVSPLSQHKYIPSPRVLKPNTFTLNNFIPSHPALPDEFDDSSSDDSLTPDAWWTAEETNAVVKMPEAAQPRSRNPVSAQASFGADHPAYLARGRKVSRAFS